MSDWQTLTPLGASAPKPPFAGDARLIVYRHKCGLIGKITFAPDVALPFDVPASVSLERTKSGNEYRITHDPEGKFFISNFIRGRSRAILFAWSWEVPTEAIPMEIVDMRDDMIHLRRMGGCHDTL